MQTSGLRLSNSSIVTSGFDYEKKRRELIRKISIRLHIKLNLFWAFTLIFTFCNTLICPILGDEIDEIDEIDENNFQIGGQVYLQK